MATPKIVPRAAGEGSLGDAAYGWGGAFITNTTTSSATQGGKLVLAADDGAVMASGHRLGVIEFKGAEDTSNTLTIGARIEALTDATWSASENGASLKFYTTDANASESLVLTLDSDKLATFAGSVNIDSVSISAIQTSSESFADNDTSLMTSAAIDDRINTAVAAEDTLAEMGDVALDSATSGNILTYNGATSRWTNTMFVGGTNCTMSLAVTGENTLNVDDAFITNNAADIMTVSDFGAAAALKIDANQPATNTAEDSVGLYIDYDRTVASSGTAAHNDIGIDLDVNSASLGTSSVKGMDIDVVGATSGTHTAIGIDLDVDSADTNVGMRINTAGTHIELVANADADDYATLAVADTGDLTIATVGDGTTDSDLILDVDGNIEINADGGTIEFKDGGTNLVSIDSTGALRSLNYRTMWIDAGSMVPAVTNGATAGTEEASTNDVMNDYYAFDTSTTEYVQFKVVLPEQWDAGTIKAKFYWKPASSTTTSHDVVWQIEATSHADGGTIDSSWGTAVQVQDTVLGTAAGRVHQSAATAAVTVAGSPGTGADELVYFRVARASGSAVADDLNEDAHLLGVLIQYKESLTTDAAW